MSTPKRIGIVGLGWLGQSLGEFLKPEADIWGTVSTAEKAEKINAKGIHALVWRSDERFSEEMRAALHQTDILVLNLPPSVFSSVTYAEGLCSFLMDLPERAKVIFTSSTGIYPDHLTDAKETYVFQPEESNRLLEAELSLRDMLGDRLCVLRLAGLIGEDRNPVHYLAKKAVNDHPDKPINLIHRLDILRVIRIIIQKDYFGEILNVCHPEHPTRKDYYGKMAKQLQLPPLHFASSIENEPIKIVNSYKLQEHLNYNSFEML